MKAKKFLLITGILVLALTLMACNLTSLISQVSNEVKNGASSNGGESTSNVLFSDDFSKTSSGWDRISDDYGENDYVDGTYQFRIDAANYDLWANPGKNFTDTVIDVDATLVDGPEDNDFGVICRFTDSENFYFAEVASDGYYIIGKYVDGSMSPLGSEQMVETNLVNSGNTTNHIRFECSGSNLALYINGSLASQVTDTDLTSGDVGLIAGDYDTTGVTVAFDNFVVTQP